jgi:hypothetical protein
MIQPCSVHDHDEEPERFTTCLSVIHILEVCMYRAHALETVKTVLCKVRHVIGKLYEKGT